MNELLQCGVVGLGVGEQHALTYQNDPRCQLAALCDSDLEKLAVVGSRFAEAEKFSDWKVLLTSRQLDVISVASPDNAHVDQIESALTAGIHVFAEKPLCQTREELTRIRVAQKSRGSFLLTNLILRKASAFMMLREAISSGELGEIYAFDGDYLYGRLQKITEGWRGEIPFYSVIQGGAVHLIDLMHWCLGELPHEVRTEGSQIASRGSRFRYPDFSASTFSFPSGIIGRITANFGCVHRHQHVVRVVGTKGTFLSDALGPRIVRSREGDTHLLGHLSSLPVGKGFLIPDFLDALSAGETVRHNAMDSHFHTMQLCLAADEALNIGCKVKISYE